MPEEPVDRSGDPHPSRRRGLWSRLTRSSRPRTDAPATPSPAPVPAARATLRDPELQAAFERDGYVLVDLLDAATTAELRACYDRMEHHPQQDSPWVHGFETSLYDERRAYREQILRDAEATMAGPLDEILLDHRIMFANYVVKLPHADEVPQHADWTFLDEERFRSATIWCPLVDTSPELDNGPLGMKVGSQDRIDFLRIANLPAYDRCVEAVADLPVVVPAMRAGQAVVMDNRVVHFSLPNHTDEVRVAMGLVVGPAEADLHHYWLDEDDHLLRFTLDRSFYLNYAIGQPLGTDGVLAVDEVPAGSSVPSR